jgi:hypothetical protein
VVGDDPVLDRRDIANADPYRLAGCRNALPGGQGQRRGIGSDKVPFVNRGVARLVFVGRFIAVIGEGVVDLLEVLNDLLATPELPLVGRDYNGIGSLEVCGSL